MVKAEITTSFLMNWRKNTHMHKYQILPLPMAEEESVQHTDYIAYDKRSPETALNLSKGIRKAMEKIFRTFD